MPHPLQQRVRAVCRRAHYLVVVHALCCFVGIVLATALLLGLTDYIVRFRDPGIRILSSVALLAVLAWSLFRFVVPAFRRRFRELAVAERIEMRFPELDDHLSTAIEFLQSSPSDNTGSPALQHAVIAEAEALLKSLDVFDCLNWQGLYRALTVASPVLLFAAVVCLSDLDSASRAARRLIAPWQQEAWPQWNDLEFTAKPTRIGLGQDFEVELIDRNGHLPADVKLEYWFDDDPPDRIEVQSMQRTKDRMVQRRERVTRSFKYRAVGGDDKSMAWISLQVVEPPHVEQMQMHITPPTYSGLPAVQQTGGAIHVLAGSTIEITGQSDRPVASAALHVEVDNQVQSFPAMLSEGGRGFAITADSMAVEGEGHYWLQLTEADGVSSGQATRETWHSMHDQPPEVAIAKPPEDTSFTAKALVPLRVTATDDLAVQDVTLHVSGATIPLDGPRSPRSRQSLPPEDPDRQPASFDLDLRPLALQPGDVVELEVVASDFKPQDGLPAYRSLQIISQEEFDRRFEARQKKLLQQLADALHIERSTHNQVESLQLQIEGTGSLPPRDQGVLESLEFQHRQVARLLDSDPQAARKTVARLLAALADNRLDRPDAARQLKSFSTQLETLAGTSLPTIQEGLISASRLAKTSPDNHGDVAPLLRAAGDEQKSVIASLQEMVDRLGALGDYRRFAREFAALLRQQQELAGSVSELKTVGKRLEALTIRQQTQLRRIAQQQLALARQFDRLHGEMIALGRHLQATEPLPAATLAEAARIADDFAISQQMRATSKSVARNQLGNANTAIRVTEEGLAAILDALANRGMADSKRRLRELQRARATLAELQRKQRAAREAFERNAQQRDDAEVNEALRQQQQIAAAAARTAKRLERLQANAAGDAAELGAAEAAEATAAGQQGDLPSAAQAAADAQQRLADAETRLLEEIQQAEQNLDERRTAELQREIQTLAAKQRALVDASIALRAVGDQTQVAEVLPGLALQQQELADKTTGTRERLSPSQIFQLGLSLAARRMEQAAEMFSEKSLDDDSQQQQLLALRRLEQLLAAMQAEASPPVSQAPKEQESSASANKQPLPYSVAELRLLHLMQLEIQDRTMKLQQRRQSEPTSSEAITQELQQLAEEQAQLADLIGTMMEHKDASPAASPPAGDVDSELDRALEKAGASGLGDF